MTNIGHIAWCLSRAAQSTEQLRQVQLAYFAQAESGMVCVCVCLLEHPKKPHQLVKMWQRFQLMTRDTSLFAQLNRLHEYGKWGATAGWTCV